MDLREAMDEAGKAQKEYIKKNNRAIKLLEEEILTIPKVEKYFFFPSFQ